MNTAVFIVWLLVCALIGIFYAVQCGKDAALGLFLGLIAGPLGWIAIALMPARRVHDMTYAQPIREPDLHVCEACGKTCLVTDLPHGTYRCKKCSLKFQL